MDTVLVTVGIISTISSVSWAMYLLNKIAKECDNNRNKVIEVRSKVMKSLFYNRI